MRAARSTPQRLGRSRSTPSSPPLSSTQLRASTQRRAARTEFDPGYVEWAPPPDLSFAIVCLWRGRVGDPKVPYTDRVLPDACVDLVWSDEQLFVAGADTGPVLLSAFPARTYVGLRMKPGRAAHLLGCPSSAVRDLRVRLADVWSGPDLERMKRMTGEIATEGDGRRVAECLTVLARQRLAAAAPPDRLIDGLIAALRQPRRTPLPIAKLASELGVTQRTLHRRCTHAVGYGPKTLDRVVRFRTMQRLARRDPSLAQIALAAAAGYADQAHMARECRRLSGLTPRRLLEGTAPMVADE